MTPHEPTLAPEAVAHREALARALEFARRFGPAHVALALHAAVPLGLTPEFLHLIRFNFLRHEVPWVAEPDLLLSPLCRDVGGYYQMDPEIRDLLLDELREEPTFGRERLRDVAGLLLVWARQGRTTDDDDERTFRLAQEWTALAYLDPEQAAAQLARAALAGSNRSGAALHAARIADALAAPLLVREDVLLYIAGLDSRAQGDRRREKRIFDLLGYDKQLRVGGYTFPAPRDLPPRDDLPEKIVNSLGMRFVLVRPGTFLMGSPDDEPQRWSGEGPQHEVEITEPFYMGVHQVTQADYERVMGHNPSYFKEVKDQDTRRFPVEQVSWEDAIEFCRRLSELPEEKNSGRLYLLPTEAEWEYTCRGGPSSSILPFHFQSPTSSLSSNQANFDGNYPYGGADKGPYLQRPTPVGEYDPNALGIYDMHGNVLEWCADWFEEDYYSKSPKKDPKGPQSGKRRVRRGGSFVYVGRFCRAAYRDGYSPADRYRNIGLRVVLLPAARTS